MKTTSVSIVSRKQKRKGTSETVSDVAFASFNAFRPFINVYDPGVKVDGSPIHTITKEDWRQHKLYRQHRSAQYADGRKFNPYLDVVRHIYSPHHVHEHHEGKGATYFTSGKRGLGILYLDVDAHYHFQTDEYRGKALLTSRFQGYFRASHGGQNGYLKVRYTTIEEFNSLAAFVQERVRLWFLSENILCDFEVKGTITTPEKSGLLGKLPFGSKCPCEMKDESDSWNYPQLAKFEAAPILNARFVRRIAEGLPIDEEKAAQWKEHVQTLKDDERQQDEVEECRERELLARFRKRPVTVPERNSKNEVLRADALNMQTVGSRPSGITPIRGQKLSGVMSEPDARKRRMAVIDHMTRRLRRLPTAEEVLEFIQANGLYSAPWENPKRRRDIENILSFRAQTFDPTKLGTKAAPDYVSDVLRLIEKHRRWAKVNCPKGWHDLPSLRVDEFGVVHTKKRIPGLVKRGSVAVALGIVEFCCGKNEDRSIPQDWIEAIWRQLHELGRAPRWSWQKWAIIKKHLRTMGVVHCDGLSWKTRANRYELGSKFPRTKRKAPSPPVFPVLHSEHTYNVLNHLDTTRGVLLAESADFDPPERPPPWIPSD